MPYLDEQGGLAPSVAPVYAPPPAPETWGATGDQNWGTFSPDAAPNYDGSTAPGVPDAGAAPAAPGSITTGANYTPDYTSLLQNDPSYLAAQSAATTAAGAGSAERRAAIRRAYIMYGGQLPPGFNDQYGDIDQTTKDAASGNQNSKVAQLAYSHSQGLEQFKRSLAARGALQSGDLSYGQDQLDRGYGQQQYDEGNRFLDDTNQSYGRYTGILGQNAQNMTAAVGQAESNVYSNPAYRPTQTSTATYDAGLAAQYGQPVYTDSSGNIYDSNGKRL